jgi:hypothetical protein
MSVFSGGGRTRRRLGSGALGLAAIVLVGLCGGCASERVVEDTTASVTVRYNGIDSTLADATREAQAACARHGGTATLRSTEVVAYAERFAHFNCR